MLARRLVIVLSLGTFLVACRSDGSSSSDAASPSSDVASPSIVVSTPDSAVPTNGATAPGSVPLLVSELPEFSGPTVLWFWAPG